MIFFFPTLSSVSWTLRGFQRNPRTGGNDFALDKMSLEFRINMLGNNELGDLSHGIVSYVRGTEQLL